MSKPSSTYFPKLEALHSLMIGIVLALTAMVSGALVIGILNGEIWHAATTSFQAFGAFSTVQSLLFGLLAAIFSLGFWYVFLLLFAMPQYFLLVLPLLKFLSVGLQGDAHRHWCYYVVSGTLTGGLPWLLLACYLFGNSIDFNDVLKLFVLPAFLIGAIAGAVLKYRLTKLATSLGIENSIK